jgi:glycosyltransferase involved in cell wall biosynthesis
MPKVSVIVITYNHQNYLRQTLDTVVSQQTNFDFEVVVSDDCSTDDTQQIILEYQQKHPHLIVPLLHNKNLGGYGKNNTLAALAVCKGTYIAALDGDDYWTSPHKLQKQVDFLEKHPTFSACFHNAMIVYDQNLLPPEPVNKSDQKTIIIDEDLVGEDEVWFIATSACMFRNGILKDYPRWFHESKSGDIPRYVLLCKWGPIGYIDEIMSVYRKNVAGMSFTDSKKDIDFIYNRINMFIGIDKEYDHRFHYKMRHALAKYYLMLANSHAYQHSFYNSRFYALKSLWMSRPNTKSHIAQVLLDNVIPRWIQLIYSRIKWKIKS